MKKASMKANFVQMVIQQGSLPLPILNKIQDKMLFLENYAIEPDNFEKLVDAF